ncbi:MAG: cytochrome c biogenesis CcdA family protein, partial [Rhodospirillales bacterium]
MNSELLGQLQEISAASPAAFALVVVAGLLMGVAPSSVPLMSVVVGSVAGQSEAKTPTGIRHALLFSGGFVLGMATVDAAVGGLFGFLGYAVIEALAGYLSVTNLAIAALLGVIGLALLRLVHIPWPRLQVSPRPVNSFGAAYA